ncbi:uncharacterized protein I303_106244 [Kwoniella dejecticola CBS 10117]|uniref:Uncharacterized protein n=1 Tax=Kwoniella dejecticola CBS 10117 TaxID=1296121 RepID=A0A1A6A1N8_9TREE|nr:uncharacterized protein I303_06263 [Kwoniella dejecticola CBS 10117]OBR83976.1 hypothetical protein I303_06263 [Kwoniella dejecticola CBS 10117]
MSFDKASIILFSSILSSSFIGQVQAGGLAQVNLEFTEHTALGMLYGTIAGQVHPGDFTWPRPLNVGRGPTDFSFLIYDKDKKWDKNGIRDDPTKNLLANVTCHTEAKKDSNVHEFTFHSESPFLTGEKSDAVSVWCDTEDNDDFGKVSKDNIDSNKL